MSGEPLPNSEIILYQTEDGRTRIQCRFENETLWLTQALLAELFEKDVRTINEHLVNIFDEGELSREATLRKFRIVRILSCEPLLGVVGLDLEGIHWVICGGESGAGYRPMKALWDQWVRDEWH